MYKSRFFIVFVALIGLMMVSGCSKSTSKKKGAGEGGLSESDLDAQREGRFGSGSIPSAEGDGMFRDIHFDYDSANISDMARQDIESNLQVLQSNPDVHVQLEGHCDERGTAEYNLSLGDRRARAVREVLNSYGVAAGRLDIISYGEEVPLDPSHSEDAFAKNRRVHFSAHTGAAPVANNSTGNVGGGAQGERY